MKIAGIAIALLFCVSFLHAQNSAEKDEFAKKIVEAVKEKGFDKYRKLLVTAESYLDEVYPMIYNEKPKDFRDPEMVAYIRQKLDSTNRHLFAMIKEEGSKSGITDWSKIKFEKLDIVKPKPSKEKYIEKMLIGDIWITYMNQHYVLHGFDAVKLSMGYRMMLLKGIQKR